MVPDIRTKDEGWAMPPFDVVPSDVEGFMDALRAFQSPCHDCCARSEPRAPFFDYMVGPLRARERQSIEPMALAIAGGNIRGMQRFISDDPWDEAQMRWHDHHLVAEALGAPNGVVMFAETGFVTKGQESAGVARQYGGALGKGENCQGGVCAA